MTYERARGTVNASALRIETSVHRPDEGSTVAVKRLIGFEKTYFFSRPSNFHGDDRQVKPAEFLTRASTLAVRNLTVKSYDAFEFDGSFVHRDRASRTRRSLRS